MKQNQLVFQHEITQQVQLKYLLYLPKAYGEDVQQQWPLILFLHGAGERGDNLALVRKHGIPKIVEKRKDFPFITVSPQCPERSWWSDQLLALDALLKEVQETYCIDRRRIYVTGLSMGGYGTWHLACEYPQRFAAIAPICGGGVWAYGFPERVRALKEMPVWAFHGAKDGVVPPVESERLVEELRACGGNVRFTLYPEAEHDSWTQTYKNPKLYQWFLEQQLA